jgi:ribonuclease HI
MREIIVYTDGSANNKKTARDGGLGVVIRYKNPNGTLYKKDYCEGQFVNTSSARMEILAAIRALELIKPTRKYKIKIHSDNQYVVKTVMCGWLENWLVTQQNKANMDLWHRFNSIFKSHGGLQNVELIWIKGHAGIELNELADKLANQGRKKQQLITDRKNEI